MVYLVGSGVDVYKIRLVDGPSSLRLDDVGHLPRMSVRAYGSIQIDIN